MKNSYSFHVQELSGVVVQSSMTQVSVHKQAAEKSHKNVSATRKNFCVDD